METLNFAFFTLLICGTWTSAVDTEMSDGMTTEVVTLPTNVLSDLTGPEVDRVSFYD